MDKIYLHQTRSDADARAFGYLLSCNKAHADENHDDYYYIDMADLIDIAYAMNEDGYAFTIDYNEDTRTRDIYFKDTQLKKETVGLFIESYGKYNLVAVSNSAIEMADAKKRLDTVISNYNTTKGTSYTTKLNKMTDPFVECMEVHPFNKLTIIRNSTVIIGYCTHKMHAEDSHAYSNDTDEYEYEIDRLDLAETIRKFNYNPG